jgi:hypothetical protein
VYKLSIKEAIAQNNKVTPRKNRKNVLVDIVTRSIDMRTQSLARRQNPNFTADKLRLNPSGRRS